jgi:spore maturation protein B
MTIGAVSEQLGNILVLLFLVGIPLYAHFRKVPVYDTFIKGATEGIPTFIRIVPYMVAMLVAVGMLRASGAFDLLNNLLAPVLAKIGIPPEIVPIVLIRPFSASAATGVVADLLHTQGGNTLHSHLGVIVAAASAETTFYIVAVYFGAAGIRSNRHVIPASLMVDVVGMLSAIWIGTWLLG